MSVSVSVRTASPSDGDAIRTVVRRSMETSYALAPSTIGAAVLEWFDDEGVAAAVDDDARELLVAEREGDVIGVVDVAHVSGADTGEVRWLHVHPDYRGEGLGRELFEQASEWLEDAGADHVRGFVLTDNADGNAFYRKLDFECVGEREVDIDGTAHTERVYHASERDGGAVVQDDGRELYVDEEDPRNGAIGPFYVTYTDPEQTERYGYQCGHCDALTTSMDTMGRIECERCGNTRRPTRWDAAYM